MPDQVDDVILVERSEIIDFGVRENFEVLGNGEDSDSIQRSRFVFVIRRRSSHSSRAARRTGLPTRVWPRSRVRRVSFSPRSWTSRAAVVLPSIAATVWALATPSPRVDPFGRPSRLRYFSGSGDSKSWAYGSVIGRFFGRPPGLPLFPA